MPTSEHRPIRLPQDIAADNGIFHQEHLSKWQDPLSCSIRLKAGKDLKQHQVGEVVSPTSRQGLEIDSCAVDSILRSSECRSSNNTSRIRHRTVAGTKAEPQQLLHLISYAGLTDKSPGMTCKSASGKVCIETPANSIKLDRGMYGQPRCNEDARCCIHTQAQER